MWNKKSHFCMAMKKQKHSGLDAENLDSKTNQGDKPGLLMCGSTWSSLSLQICLVLIAGNVQVSLHLPKSFFVMKDWFYILLKL